MDYRSKFMVQPGEAVDLKKVDAGFTGSGESRETAERQLEANHEQLRELQRLLYAESKRSLLVCLQGRDAAGKDGTIRRVFGVLNPQGCRVTSFKTPSGNEAAHDYLWRCHQVTPAQGQIALFNRSHYEDVLIVRVHNLVPKDVWSKRYDHINDFERLLWDNGTQILKFFLHIDEDEQLERFKKRIDNPAKNWKISESDYSERHYWNDYSKAFEEVLFRCSTPNAPWFVIPSNRKWFRNLAISQIVVDTMKAMKMSFPEPAVDMKEIRKKYHQAAKES